MNSKEQTIFKPNASKPVYKFNLSGELVHTYPRTTDAIQGEHIMYAKLKELIASGNSLRHHIFSFSMHNGRPIRENELSLNPDTNGRMPWESANGMFHISGWGKVCL
jgi:hypothetical protein